MSTHADEPRPADPAGASDPAADAVMDTLRAFQRLQAVDARVTSSMAATIGISAPDVRALLFIAGEDAATPKRVGESLRVTSGAVTNIVDRLAAAGLVERASHPRDRRSVVLRLAPLGVATVHRILDPYRRAIQGSIAKEDLPRLADALTAIGTTLLTTSTEVAVPLHLVTEPDSSRSAHGALPRHTSPNRRRLM